MHSLLWLPGPHAIFSERFFYCFFNKSGLLRTDSKQKLTARTGCDKYSMSPQHISADIWVMHSLVWLPGPDTISSQRFFYRFLKIKAGLLRTDSKQKLTPRTLCGKYLVIPWHISVEIRVTHPQFWLPGPNAISSQCCFLLLLKN